MIESRNHRIDLPARSHKGTTIFRTIRIMDHGQEQSNQFETFEVDVN